MGSTIYREINHTNHASCQIKTDWSQTSELFGFSSLKKLSPFLWWSGEGGLGGVLGLSRGINHASCIMPYKNWPGRSGCRWRTTYWQESMKSGCGRCAGWKSTRCSKSTKYNQDELIINHASCHIKTDMTLLWPLNSKAGRFAGRATTGEMKETTRMNATESLIWTMMNKKSSDQRKS